MVTSFTSVVHMPAEAATETQERPQEQTKDCGYWLKYIFCCGCRRKAKAYQPSAPVQSPMRAQGQVPTFDLNALPAEPPAPVSIALSVLSSEGSASASASVSASQTFALSFTAPGEALPDNNNNGVHCNVSVASTGRSLMQRTVIASAAMSQAAPVDASTVQVSVFGTFALLRQQSAEGKDNAKAQV